MIIDKKNIANWFKDLQNKICNSIEKADAGSKFKHDLWERKGGGGGISRVIEKGNIIEKGGVNFSEVYGETPENILTALQLDKADFYATGVSIVMHPLNPMIPIIHMNVRYFEMSNGNWWFGGGIDLTPHYIDKKEASFFHQSLKKVCDKHHSAYYNKFKRWADDYFFLKHRNETRGVGGIFFDRLSDENKIGKEQRFNFVKDVGELFAPTYIKIIDDKKGADYGQQEKKWQKIRRGRYVEFNLVWDKGTKFGLDTGGRTESILMSLPPVANWDYNYVAQKGSHEEETLQLLKKNIDWINI